MREEYRVFQIDKQDTVATALQDIPRGERVHIIGNCTEHSIVATTDIPVGLKRYLFYLLLPRIYGFSPYS